MSQYPPPFPMPPADPYQPAKAAGMMMIILGCFALLGSACGLVVSLLPFEEIAKQQPDLVKQFHGMTFDQVRLVMRIFGGGSLVVAVVQFVLASQVRRGARTPTMVAVIFSILLAGWFALNTLDGFTGNAPPLASVLPLALTAAFGFQIKLLARAYRSGPAIALDQAAQQQQYAQFVQQQQAYQQQYGVMPPINYMPYGPGAYNAPAGTAGTNTAQTGWVWQPPGGAVPPPPPKDESHEGPQA